MSKQSWRPLTLNVSNELSRTPVPVGEYRSVVLVDDGGVDEFQVSVDDSTGTPVPHQPGDELCDGRGIETLYVTTVGQGGEAILLAVREGADANLAGTAAVAGGSAGGPPGPERLEGDLGSGTTIAAGETASEEIDTSEAERVRVRAALSGMSDFTQVSTASEPNATGPTPVSISEDLGLALTTSPQQGEVVAWNISNPDSISRTSGFSPAAIDTDTLGVQVMEDIEKALVLGADSGTSELRVVLVDISDPAAMSQDDFSTVGSQEGVTRDLDNFAYFPDLGTDGVVVGTSAYGFSEVGALFVCDIDTGAPGVTLTIVDEPGSEYGAVAGDPSRGLVVVHAPGAVVQMWRVVDGSTLNLVSEGGGNGVQFEGVALNADRRLVWVTGNGGPFGAAESSLYSYTATGVLSLERDGIADVGGQNVKRANYARWRDDADLLALTGGFDADLKLLNMSDLASLTLLTTASIGTAKGVGFTSEDPLYVIVADDDTTELESWRSRPGSDRLRLTPLLSNGDRASTWIVTVTDIRDGSEAILTADVVGPDAVDVEVQARGPNDTNVSWVEVAQE